MNRRSFLFTGTASAAFLVGTTALWRMGTPTAALAMSFEVTKTESEWRALLNDAQYAVLREENTERAGTSPLNAEKRKGIFHCAGCDLPAYSSEAKYESGTGWPSFWESLPDTVGTKEDNSLFGMRIEVHCRRCGGHFGHIFDDGPPPTGKRHCLNGIALAFKPATL
ncbi:MAG: peptide-methionine (R)-S-oxide reductase MsrB [Pseudaminobacter sp.]|nr:peptide-methionine (R)-S-oxide reductase MsrB [Pseudaminobacter sp.]